MLINRMILCFLAVFLMASPVMAQSMISPRTMPELVFTATRTHYRVLSDSIASFPAAVADFGAWDQAATRSASPAS